MAERYCETQGRSGFCSYCLRSAEKKEVRKEVFTLPPSRYQANLDRRKLGFDVLAFAQVRFGNHSANAPDDFEQVIRGLPEVLSCHKVTGEADYVLTVLATDLESYGRFVEDVLRRQPGIASIQSSLALREIKAVTRIPVLD
ncbi:Lrp/AsnC ligand binding domain protein [compost metagenome]